MLHLIRFLAASITLVSVGSAMPTERARTVPAAKMQRLHDEVKTPFRYGVVLRGEKGEMLDCPSVFRYGGRWYMLHAAIRHHTGYETHLARSDDLLHWERLGKVLPLRGEGWDAWQANGGIALYDIRWDGTHELRQHDGKYCAFLFRRCTPGLRA